MAGSILSALYKYNPQGLKKSSKATRVRKDNNGINGYALPFPTPGDFPDPGIEPACPVSPALQASSLSAEPSGKHYCFMPVQM